jgi:hypothetical protein
MNINIRLTATNGPHGSIVVKALMAGKKTGLATVRDETDIYGRTRSKQDRVIDAAMQLVHTILSGDLNDKEDTNGIEAQAQAKEMREEEEV